MNLTKSQKIFFMAMIPAFLLAFGLSALRTLIIPKQYVSMATLEIKNLAGQTGATGILQAQERILQSDLLLSKVSDLLDLENVWGHKIKLDGIMNKWETVMLLKRQLEITSVPPKGHLLIRFYDDDKFEASRIANEIASVYLMAATEANIAMKPEIHERAMISAHPVHPNVPLRLAFGAVAALVFSIGVGGLASWMVIAMENAAMEKTFGRQPLAS